MRISKRTLAASLAVLTVYAAAVAQTASPEILDVDASPLKVVEYENVRLEDERVRLDHFAIAFQNDPTAQGYLVCYGGRRSRRDDAQRRCDRARDYLASTRNMDTSRIVTVDAGFREEPTVELWLVPSGVTPPQASPTVDPSEVRPPRPHRRPRGRVRR